MSENKKRLRKSRLSHLRNKSLANIRKKPVPRALEEEYRSGADRMRLGLR